MSEVSSTFELRYGDGAPGFELPDAWKKNRSFKDVAGKEGTIVVFACNHCPFVIHLAKQLGELSREVAAKGINTVAINSNDLGKYPQDGPEAMKDFAEESAWDFLYLLDRSQDIAKQYGAACTPDFFLFDAEGRMVYAGQFDDSRPGRGTATGDDLRTAIAKMLEGEVPKKGIPSSGCNIKWKPGNEPRWFGH